MARSTFSCERYIPHSAVKIADKQSDAVAYIYADAKGRPCARVFFGKQAKPVVAYSFRNTAERETTVIRAFEGRRASLASKAEMKTKRTAENRLKVGDILSASWGYEQTNVDFYEVTASEGKFVTIRKIAAASLDTGNMTGRVAPQSGQYVGEPMRKLVKWGDNVRIEDYCTASKWNTNEVAGVKVGPALYTSSYH